MPKKDTSTSRAATEAADIDETVRETILLNGMPFDKSGVLKMKDGEAIWAEGLAQKAALQTRQRVRSDIAHHVGDTESILGTAADVSQLSAVALLALVVALDAETTFPGFKTKFFGTLDALIPTEKGRETFPELAQGFLSDVQSGDVKLTAGLKGFAVVLQEMGERSTGVADILSQGSSLPA